MSTQENLRDLLPDRGDYAAPQKGKIDEANLEATSKALINSRQIAKQRRIRAKEEWWRKHHGDNFVPDFDQDTCKAIPMAHNPTRIKKEQAEEDRKLDLLEAKDRVKRAQDIVPEHEATVAFPAHIQHLDTPLPSGTAQLLKTLNIDASKIQLTKAELNTLVTGLMMCSEQQLQHIKQNNETPIVVKIVIKALEMDLKVGAMDVVERLWDRLFGKPTQQVIQDVRPVSAIQELIPGTGQGPISREAYILIRERIFEDDKQNIHSIPPPYEPSND